MSHALLCVCETSEPKRMANTQVAAVPVALLLHAGRDALPQDVSGLYRDIALPMLADEEHAGRRGRVLLASNLVSDTRLSFTLRSLRSVIRPLTAATYSSHTPHPRTPSNPSSCPERRSRPTLPC